MDFTCKVCVLGAGPAGMVLANLLLAQGIDCIVVDKYWPDEIFQRARAGLLDHPSIAILKKHGLSASLFENGTPHTCCEFRIRGQHFVLEYSNLADGHVHYIYPQQSLIRDIIDIYQARHGRIRFATEAINLDMTNAPTVTCYDKNLGMDIHIHCDFIAGCDGFHGISRRAIPPQEINVFDSHFNFAWLAVLAEAPPSTEHIIYAIHSNGFAGHMLRNEKISRYYLQIGYHDQLSDWPDERVWLELESRLAKESWQLERGPILDKQIVSMRNMVVEPLRYQKLFLVGDSAHIITPTGGKGMNLAIQDAQALAETIATYYNNRDDACLDRYSAERLPAIWRTQAFSSTFLDMLCRTASVFEQSGFARKLHETALLQLRDNAEFARWFARSYVGA